MIDDALLEAEDKMERAVGAAREEFGERGFDGATVRGIAGRAGVDAAMIAHHFGSKQQLFLATMALPFDPAVEIAAECWVETTTVSTVAGVVPS